MPQMHGQKRFIKIIEPPKLIEWFFCFYRIFINIINNKLNKILKTYGKYCKSIWTSKGWC